MPGDLDRALDRTSRLFDGEVLHSRQLDLVRESTMPLPHQSVNCTLGVHHFHKLFLKILVPELVRLRPVHGLEPGKKARPHRTDRAEAQFPDQNPLQIEATTKHLEPATGRENSALIPGKISVQSHPSGQARLKAFQFPSETPLLPILHPGQEGLDPIPVPSREKNEIRTPQIGRTLFFDFDLPRLIRSGFDPRAHPGEIGPASVFTVRNRGDERTVQQPGQPALPLGSGSEPDQEIGRDQSVGGKRQRHRKIRTDSTDFPENPERIGKTPTRSTVDDRHRKTEHTRRRGISPDLPDVKALAGASLKGFHHPAFNEFKNGGWNTTLHFHRIDIQAKRLEKNVLSCSSGYFRVQVVPWGESLISTPCFRR